MEWERWVVPIYDHLTLSQTLTSRILPLFMVTELLVHRPARVGTHLAPGKSRGYGSAGSDMPFFETKHLHDLIHTI